MKKNLYVSPIAQLVALPSHRNAMYGIHILELPCMIREAYLSGDGYF